MSALLDVCDLTVTFRGQGGPVPAVEGLSFTLAESETLAIVGESSSGKSVTALALMRLLAPPPTCRIGGSAILRAGTETLDLLGMSDAAMQDVRGKQIAMIFQEPMTSLNPVHTVGTQIAETLIAHEHFGSNAATARAVELLDLVGITEPRRRLASYPHQLSGGMRQRAMIAMALACRPRVLIADEPTTALDVTIQAQILDLLRRLQSETGMAVIFITHNLGVVAELADRVLVMYAGQVVEEAPLAALLRCPLMPYTTGLLQSVPRLDAVLRKGVRLRAIQGNVPDPANKPVGCTFHTRCGYAAPGVCDVSRPHLETAAQEHRVRCCRWRDIAA
jgi:oligopeptide transport system ATP-binding protein